MCAVHPNRRKKGEGARVWVSLPSPITRSSLLASNLGVTNMGAVEFTAGEMACRTLVVLGL
jgi:hypothetical protein